MIRILTTFYNSELYFPKTVISLRNQTIKDWKCYVTDDMSSRRARTFLESTVGWDDKFEIIYNDKKMWQSGNYWQVLQKEEIDDNDICITLDGDDWFPDNKVLERVLKYYEDNNTWMTFGQFLYYDKGGKTRMGFSRKPNLFSEARRLPWTSTHLRTFKAFLYRKVDKKDLIDPSTGCFWQMAGDVVTFSPMLEMAGEDRVKYYNDINYVYNVETDMNEFKTDLGLSTRITRDIANMKKYERIE